MTDILKKTLPYYRKYMKLIAAGIMLGIGGSVMDVFIPKYIRGIANTILEGMDIGMDFAAVRREALLSAAVIAAGFLLKYLQTVIMSRAGRGMIKDMRSAVSGKMDRIPMSYYDTMVTGDVLSRVTDDISTFAAAVSTDISDIIFSAIMMAACIVMMLRFNVILTACVIAGTAAGTLINSAVVKKNMNASRAQRRLLGKMNGDIEEIFTGHLVIKSFNCEDDVLKRFNENNDSLAESMWRSNFYRNVMPSVMAFVGNLSYVTVCVAGAVLMNLGKTDIGTIVAFILYVKMFSNPISRLARNIGKLQPAMASAERVIEFLDTDELADDGKASVREKKGRVVFDRVRFGYQEDRIILKDFSAVVEPGMKVAVVGPTGAGKTTLVNLLMRFYELNSGNISIDGVPVCDMPRGELRSMLTMVPQETWCFDGTIRENIVYSTPGVTEDRLNEVIEKAGLSFLTDSLPEGVDTVISEQSSVSAGQKQLITIARAMLRDSTVLILDEATSSVDTRTELCIQNALDELTKGKTSFVIAHRLSTVRNADMIFVLKDGDIIETGTHRGLLEAGGFYSELYYSQFDRENDS